MRPKEASGKSDTVTDLASYVILLFFLGPIILGLYWWSRKRLGSEPTKQRETDIRLTYKRFKELYPHSQITYQEYKKLQAEKAFKRAVSSEKIKRMVR